MLGILVCYRAKPANINFLLTWSQLVLVPGQYPVPLITKGLVMYHDHCADSERMIPMITGRLVWPGIPN